jgi:two-component system, chemotaxis family, protein-glutamate methylesterase/glutaminase
MSDKVRLLLVDDSALVRDLLFRSISAFDSSIEVVGVAVNGRDGLEKLAALKPDVVVTDMDMPVMNGLEFIRQAMMQRPLPIIVLSSWTQNDKSITLQAGFDAVPTNTGIISRNAISHARPMSSL